MSRRGLTLALALLVAQPVLASEPAPDGSLRPQARAEAEVPTVVRPVARVSTSGKIRPLSRPLSVTPEVVEPARPTPLGAAAAPTSDDLAANTPGVIEVSAFVRSLRPNRRPEAIVEKAMARQREANRGRLAGIRGVQGDAIGPVKGKGACGIDNALRVTKVSGVKLSIPALMDARTAKALKAWVDNGLIPAIGSMGGGVKSMRVVAHYACRTRNSQPGARLSEHSFGRAIDIAGFTLNNGEQIVLLNDWNNGRKGTALRKMHRTACGKFGTVLGPEANRFHRDHFHFDTARHRSGSFCR